MRTRITLSVALWLGLGTGFPARAQDKADLPPQVPILRIEPGMHTAPVKRVGVDRACSLMATGSEDKTVRLWDISTARDGKLNSEPRLIRTMRPALGPGNDGKIFTVTMSPDGRWIAAGGWSRTGKGHWVNVFDAVSGRLMRRLDQQGNVIHHLAVSPDGRFLAATLGEGHGLRVWETASWRLLGQDQNYGGKDSYGAAFDGAGNLFTVSYDMNLRRYSISDRSVKLEATSKMTAGQQPFSVAVRPARAAGAQSGEIAVAFIETAAVIIYDARTLKPVHTVDMTGVTNDLVTVAWSADGTRLYAAGRYSVGAAKPIRIWGSGGRGEGTDVFPGPSDTLMNVVPCGDSMAFVSQDPTFGLIDAAGRRIAWQSSVIPDMRSKRFELLVSEDGRRVRFGLEQGSATPVVFDLAAEQLLDSPAKPADLFEADTKSLPVTDWINTTAPKVSGKAITLDSYEIARSLAVTPDKQRFVLGADWWVRGFTAEGTEQWRKPVPGVVWGLNIPQGGKALVVAYGDGTIRWHRLSDGKELIALFVHKRDRRWVAWTPKGYYMASPGAESLIGWHVNRSWDQAADFFPADRFRETFSRPDVVKLVLETLDEEKAVEEANKRAKVTRGAEDVRSITPPLIEIQRPTDNATFRTNEVTVEYIATSPTGQRITDIDVRVNNLALGSRAPVPVDSKAGQPIRLTLTLPPEDVLITLVAREGNRASEPAHVRLRWDGAKGGQSLLPRLRAVFVGIDKYDAPSLPPLRYAAKDARDLDTFFRGQVGRTYSKVETRLLADAKRADVLDGLEWLETGSEEGDINMIFLAGHGLTDEQQHFYYMASDGDPDRPRASGVSRDELLRTIRNLKGARVVMLDTCHSGATMDAPTAKSRVDMNRLANEIGDRTLGVFLYASALGRQFSYEHESWGNGAFTKALIEGLAGAADREKAGFVETDELGLYVRRRVLSLTQQRQEPVRIKPDAAPEMRLVVLKQ